MVANFEVLAGKILNRSAQATIADCIHFELSIGVIGVAFDYLGLQKYWDHLLRLEELSWRSEMRWGQIFAEPAKIRRNDLNREGRRHKLIAGELNHLEMHVFGDLLELSFWEIPLCSHLSNIWCTGLQFRNLAGVFAQSMAVSKVELAGDAVQIVAKSASE